MKLDPSLSALLPLPANLASQTRVSSVSGGSGFASSLKIAIPSSSSSNKNSKTSDHLFFAKTSPSPGAEEMFAGESASLNAIHAVVPSLCPRSFGYAQLTQRDRGSGSWGMVTEWLGLSRSSSRPSGSGMSLAKKLAILHTTPAPVPEGQDEPVFGFPVTTCCGDTPQDNTYERSWARFYADRRLRPILRRSEQRNGNDAELRKLVERTAGEVVPRLLGEGHLGGKAGIKPVVAHGDLWSGNKGRAVFSGRESEEDEEGEGVEEVVFDPAVCWAHREYDVGIMRMFGGFGTGFWKEYWREVGGKEEPEEEFEARANLYELYHHLNHHAIFGGGYRSGAVSIMKGLLRQYGEKERH